jgi:hypothetical protein
MKEPRMNTTRSDIALNAASILLAVFSISFASYMVMYGPGDGQQSVPKVTVALQPFDTSREKLGSFDALDPIVTGSVSKTEDGDGNQQISGLLKTGLHLQYNLRTVLQDTAFVDVSNGQSLITVPIARGAILPGVGKVLRFEQRGSKWVLITSSAEISEDGMLTLR